MTHAHTDQIQPDQLRQNKQYTTQAYCLKSWPYGESDRIIHLFSADYGKLSAIAKGAKKAGSQLAGACELLSCNTVHLARGKNLDQLQQYQSGCGFPYIRQDILKLAIAQLFAEQVYVLATEFEPDSRLIFDLLSDHLQALESAHGELSLSQTGLLAIASRFQLLLLETAGYQPALSQCVLTGEPLDAGALYYPFSVMLGGPVLSRELLAEHLPPGTDPALYNWVNVSTKTLLALDASSQAGLPEIQESFLLTAADGETAELRQSRNNGEISLNAFWEHVTVLKTQKFLRYYFTQKLELPVQAYDFLFSLL